MKKTMFTTAFVLALGLTAAWAADSNRISPEITAAAYRNQSASWNPSPDGHHNMRNISSTELPPALLKEFKESYKNFWITDLYEEGQNKHLTYHITIEDEDQVIKMNSDESDNWEVASLVLKTP